jgi:hypothetical protein
MRQSKDHKVQKKVRVSFASYRDPEKCKNIEPATRPMRHGVDYRRQYSCIIAGGILPKPPAAFNSPLVKVKVSIRNKYH